MKNLFAILVIAALFLAIVSLLKPVWPVLSVAVLLLCVAVLIKG